MNLGKLGQAFTSREVFDLIQDDLDQVEKRITAESVASVDTVTAIGQYLQSAGGKRLRPALVLLSARLAGNSGTTAIELGAVVELIHAATLVHDDVIDGATLHFDGEVFHEALTPGHGDALERGRGKSTVASRGERACRLGRPHAGPPAPTTPPAAALAAVAMERRHAGQGGDLLAGARAQLGQRGHQCYRHHRTNALDAAE